MTHHTHHYCLVEAKSVEKLMTDVNYYLKRGGSVIGSPFVFQEFLFQAMFIPHEY